MDPVHEGSDQRQGAWNKTVDYNSSLSSAEWIMEAPYSNGILPLADYDLATFVPGGNPSLNYKTEGVIMYDPHGQTSNISTPGSNGFSTAWGSGTTLTPVSPPSS